MDSCLILKTLSLFHFYTSCQELMIQTVCTMYIHTGHFLYQNIVIRYWEDFTGYSVTHAIKGGSYIARYSLTGLCCAKINPCSKYSQPGQFNVINVINKNNTKVVLFISISRKTNVPDRIGMITFKATNESVSCIQPNKKIYKRQIKYLTPASFFF